MALVLAIGCAVGGTLAWLISQTDSVVNTFTYGDININLAETTGIDYKIIPGVNISKDPKVTVTAGSEACWLFVKVKEENWPDLKETDGTTRKVNYAIAEDWTALIGHTGVYYRAVDAVTADTSFDVLKENQVTVSDTLTKEDIKGITTNPTLTFTAYAVQKDGSTNAADAWAKIPTTTKP